MDLAGDYTFDAPQALVWAALLDPNVLGAIMPGGKGIEQTGENQYTGMLEVKVGPVQGTFQGQIHLSDIVAPEHYQIMIDGKGGPGNVKAHGQLRLEARDQQTFMEYSGSAQVSGRIASVGQRLIDSAAKSIIRQSLEVLNEYLKLEVEKQAPPPVAAPVAERVAPPPVVPIPVPEYKPPSQVALGFTVARDVLDDALPGGAQPWLIAAVIIIVTLIILFAAGHP